MHKDLEGEIFRELFIDSDSEGAVVELQAIAIEFGRDGEVTDANLAFREMFFNSIDKMFVMLHVAIYY